MNTIKVATVVFYDGVRAYTTHRALYITENEKLTKQSKNALHYDIVECSGCEILKIDFDGCSYNTVTDFLDEFQYIYDFNENDVRYVKEKFFEYFIIND